MTEITLMVSFGEAGIRKIKVPGHLTKHDWKPWLERRYPADTITIISVKS